MVCVETAPLSIYLQLCDLLLFDFSIGGTGTDRFYKQKPKYQVLIAVRRLFIVLYVEDYETESFVVMLMLSLLLANAIDKLEGVFKGAAQARFIFLSIVQITQQA